MYRTKPCLPYFSSVVKNVASPNVEIKKLVYIYLLHYAESEPDLALLSINTIQKSLSDPNPQVRAMALRVMSGIRVSVISQIVSLAIKKGCGDMSPQVRKAAALAIPKCYKLEPSTLPQMVEYLSTLLGDRQYYVVGSAVSAFLEVCPHRYDLIHKHYRALVRKLVDMDDWGQLSLIRLMTYYARSCFPQKTTRRKAQRSKGFYDDDNQEASVEDVGEAVSTLDPDLELFLKACKTLLNSRNSAVVLAVVRCFLHLGTPEYIDSAAGPMVALLRSPQDLHQVVLYNIVSVCIYHAKAFVPYTNHFFIWASDPPEVWKLKVEILTLVFPHCDDSRKGLILNELEHFTKAPNAELVRESVRAIGRCAQCDETTANRCLNLLLRQASSPDGNLVAEALTVVRHFIQRDPSSHIKTVIRLAKNLDTMTNANARASIIWLVGEFSGIGGKNNIAPDVLRILCQGFADEAEVTKLQIVLLGAKVYLHHLNRTLDQRESLSNTAETSQLEDATSQESGFEGPEPPVSISTQAEHPILVLWRYIQLLARYDVSYDIRDRSRLYTALLDNSSSIQLASLILLAPKPTPHTPSPSESRKDLLLGSSTLVVGEAAGAHGLLGYEPLPNWVKAGKEPDPKLREEPGVAKTDHSHARNIPAAAILDSALKGKMTDSAPSSWSANKDKSLDDWLAEGEESEEGSTESETEEEADEEADEEYETDDEEGDDESDSDGKTTEAQKLVP